MTQEYVQQRDGAYWVAGTRISLDSIVYAFKDGLSPETIRQECFPALSLEQVYGALTYYLAHRQAIDSYLEDAKSAYESLRSAMECCDLSQLW